MAGREESKIPQIPSIEDVLARKVPFPFEVFDAWAEAFNHLKIKKGKEPNLEKSEGNFTITLPEQPSLDQILKVTEEFITQAGIEFAGPRLLALARDLRNQARLLAKLVFKMPCAEQISPLVLSLYYLGIGLEKVVKKEDGGSLREINIDLVSLAAGPYELHEGADPTSFEGELFLRLLGKDQAFFDEKSLNDPRLSLVPQHSAYYYLLRRFLERNPDKDALSPWEQMKEFDKWLIEKRDLIVLLLVPYFLDGKCSPLKEGGRTHNALWNTIIFSFFSYLDEAIEKEGWKRAKEKLLPPPLFIDLGEDLQQMLREIFFQDAQSLVFDTERFKTEDAARLVESIKKQVGETEYRRMPLFELAERVLEEKKRTNPELSLYEQMFLLWDLVQAYEYAETLKLTSAIEREAFECHLRSYVLGRLCQELLDMEVYTVLRPNHSYLLIFDKRTQNGYYVDPTASRFLYKTDEKGERVKREIRIPLKDFRFTEVLQEEWQRIREERKAHPTFSLFGRFNRELATISPFEQGIKSGFWSNLGDINFRRARSEKDPKKRKKFLQTAYRCYVNALKLTPNDPVCHNNLACLYASPELAKALGKSFRENLLRALYHYEEAGRLDPANPSYHYNLALLYTNPVLAEVPGKSFGKNLLDALHHASMAMELNPNNPKYKKLFNFLIMEFF